MARHAVAGTSMCRRLHDQVTAQIVILDEDDCPMNVDEGDFRRGYAELSDEGLLSINREELVDVARRCYDEELARRGLQGEYETGDEPEDVEDEFVVGATFLFPDEAEVARALLRSADILCYLENKHTLTAVWTWSCALGWLRLMVPASCREEVQEILSTLPPGEELEAGMEPQLGSGEQPSLIHRGRLEGRSRIALAIAIYFCSPAADLLRVIVA
jgi:hypothetical protein